MLPPVVCACSVGDGVLLDPQDVFRDLPSTATAKKRGGQLTSENDGGHQEASKENSTLVWTCYILTCIFPFMPTYRRVWRGGVVS